MIVFLALIGLLTFLAWKYFIVRPEPQIPPGPRYTMPILGQALYLGKDPTVGLASLRKRFGDILSLRAGPLKSVYVNELEAIEDLMHRDVFAGRIDIDDIINEKVTTTIRGYSPCPGLVSSSGNVWQEQRRFTLRHLRDFGFGKASMQDIILEEFQDFSRDLQRRMETDEEVEVNLLFNAMTISVLWRIVSGKGIDRDDPKQRKVFQRLQDMMLNAGVNNFLMMLGLLLIPTCLRQYDPFTMKMKRTFDELFATFQEEREEHEKSFDEEQPRDFIDVYLKECKDANKNGDKASSFYGEQGRANFNNVLFDLFLTGSETVSTSMAFTVLYCLHHPSLTKKLQNEIDKVVGRGRLPCADDRDKLPYVEAFISEIQRHGSFAPLAVPHMALEDTEARGYKFKKYDTVNVNLHAVMHDPKNFPDPEKFEPSRFLDPSTGEYHAPKGYVAFGVGKRECLGKSLAKMELFFFTTCLVHKYNLEPASGGLPGLFDVKIGLTRSPQPFKAKFILRED